jgi:hypothetical protein
MVLGSWRGSCFISYYQLFYFFTYEAKQKGLGVAWLGKSTSPGGGGPRRVSKHQMEVVPGGG